MKYSRLAAGCVAAAFVMAPAASAYRDQAAVEAEYEERHAILGVSPLTAKPPDMIYYIPAQVGGALFSAVGNVLAWPFTIGYGVSRGDFSLDTFVPPTDWSERYFGTTGAYLLGGPFWCLKKAFWDGPAWLFTPSESEPEIDMAVDTSDGAIHEEVISE